MESNDQTMQQAADEFFEDYPKSTIDDPPTDRNGQSKMFDDDSDNSGIEKYKVDLAVKLTEVSDDKISHSFKVMSGTVPKDRIFEMILKHVGRQRVSDFVVENCGNQEPFEVRIALGDSE